MPLINLRIQLELNWIKNCILSSASESAKFKITDDKLPAHIITLSARDEENLTKTIKWWI